MGRWSVNRQNDVSETWKHIPRGDYVSDKRRNTAKIKEESIPDIRRRIAAGETNRSIAASYGVDNSQISRIRTGKRWSHVP